MKSKVNNKVYKKIKILVIGDSCIDRFIYGDVSRLAPEGPIPIFNPTSELSNPGMAGNVYRNLKSIGCDPIIISNKINPIKTRYVDERSGQLMIRIDESDKVDRIDDSLLRQINKNSFIGEKINAIIVSDYNKAKSALKELLDDAVQKRLVADVPLGSFLSGGIDSSIISALAARHQKNLSTFSIGFKDEPFFDETHYAEMLAKKHHTNHTVFSLSNDNLFEHFYNFLDYLDEPFADSSALAVYILSKETRKNVTVALSGDGADEIFSGYNKHSALFK